MKTLTVEDATWKTLSQMKLDQELDSLDAVIQRLIKETKGK